MFHIMGSESLFSLGIMGLGVNTTYAASKRASFISKSGLKGNNSFHGMQHVNLISPHPRSLGCCQLCIFNNQLAADLYLCKPPIAPNHCDFRHPILLPVQDNFCPCTYSF